MASPCHAAALIFALVISTAVLDSCAAHFPFWGGFLVVFPPRWTDRRDTIYRQGSLPKFVESMQPGGNVEQISAVKSTQGLQMDNTALSKNLFNRRFPEDFFHIKRNADLDAIVFPDSATLVTQSTTEEAEGVTLSSLFVVPSRGPCPPGQRFVAGRCR